MARPTFEKLRDETMQRMGKLDPSTELVARFEQVMTSAYYTLALTYHHYELHTPVVENLAEGVGQLLLNADAYVVMTVSISPQSAPTAFRPVTHEHLYSIFPVTEKGTIKSYARTRDASDKDILIFDKAADAASNVFFYIYRRPTEPIYTGAAVSVLDDLWDEYIIQKTLQLFWPAGFRFDFAGVAQQTLAEFLQLQIQPPLVQPVRDVPERTLTSEAVGGQQ